MLEARRRVCSWLGTSDASRGHERCAWYPGIVEAFIAKAGDPETELAGWLRGGAPTGVAHPIRSCGIFPRVSKESLAQEELENFYAKSRPGENYKSVRENAANVSKELEREIEAGFSTVYNSWGAVVER